MVIPIPQHPWNPLPAEEYGDKRADPIFTAVGHALSAWERLETALAQLFAALVRDTWQVGEHAYGQIAVFSARKALIVGAIEAMPFPLPTVSGLIERCDNFCARRNEIAHGIVTNLHRDGADRFHYLVPAMYNKNKWPHSTRKEAVRAFDGFGKYAYTAKQIRYYRDQFKHLHYDANLSVSYVANAWRLIDEAVKRRS